MHPRLGPASITHLLPERSPKSLSPLHQRLLDGRSFRQDFANEYPNPALVEPFYPVILRMGHNYPGDLVCERTHVQPALHWPELPVSNCFTRSRFLSDIYRPPL
jgi:hypothetical protein